MARTRPGILVRIICVFAMLNLFLAFHQMPSFGAQICAFLGPKTIPSDFSLSNKCFSVNQEHSSAFESIYKNGVWGPRLQDVRFYYTYGEMDPGNRSSSSGVGSKVGCYSAPGLKFLSEIILQYNITTMIDAPCGDVNWQMDSMEVDHLQLYLGLDVSESVIDLNKRRFAHHKNKLFSHWDATSCPFPKYSGGGVTWSDTTFDLIHVRDVIQHLPLDKGVAFFDNIKASNIQWLITTSYPNTTNPEIKVGGWYHNDLEKPPFYLPQPLKCVQSHSCDGAENDVTCLFDMKS